MSRSSEIPDRWMDYLPVGRTIEGTRFICFKVPLSPSVFNDVEEKDRLDYKGLLNTIPNLGLIIDLTDTFRYYDPQVFESKGLSYMKLRIPGKTVPQPDLVEEFNRHVRDYLKINEHNDKLIGVHCTHGVNRTGYLVCNYMISVMTLGAEEAIRKFNAARGHKIERRNFLRALRELEPDYVDSRLRSNCHKGSGKKKSKTLSNMRSQPFRRETYFNDYEDRWNASSSRWRQNNSRDYRINHSKQSHNYNAPYNANISSRRQERSVFHNYENTRDRRDDRNGHRRYQSHCKNRDEKTWYRKN